MSDITLRQNFAAAGTGAPCRVLGPALLVQTSGPTAQVQGSNFPAVEASWQNIGSAAGYGGVSITTAYAFVRVVMGAAGDVAISSASAPAAAAAGGSAGDASAANQLTQIARLDTLAAQTDGVEGSLSSLDAKTPALSGGKVPVTDPTALPLPNGAATSARQDTANNSLASIDTKLPASLGAKSGVASLSTVPASGTLADRSGTITAGGTAQVLMAANANRIGFAIQNLSTGDLWINPLGTAAATKPSLKIASGVYYETPSGYGAVGAISVFGATTAQAFTAQEW